MQNFRFIGCCESSLQPIFRRLRGRVTGYDDVTAPLDRRRLSILQPSLVKAVDAFDPAHEAWIQRSFFTGRGVGENFDR